MRGGENYWMMDDYKRLVEENRCLRKEVSRLMIAAGELPGRIDGEADGDCEEVASVDKAGQG